MPFLLHERATLDLDNAPYDAAPMRTNREVWDRLVELVSLARAMDPTLPIQLRFAKSTPDDPITVPFVAMLTNANVQDVRVTALDNPEYAVSLTDALARALPERVWRTEMLAINSSDEMGFAGPLDAAIYTAFREAQIELKTVQEVDAAGQRVRHVASGVYRVPTLAFMNNPSLAKEAWLAPLSTDARQEQGQDPMDGAFAKIRGSVQRVRELLGQPMAGASDAEREEVLRLINGLNGRHDPKPFEARQDHGWVAFALSKKAGDWTPLLLDAGASPRQTYGGVAPMAIAIATNDVPAVEALMTTGLSANSYFQGIPPMFTSGSRRWLKGFDDQMVPALMLATVMGTAEVANHLLHRGADVNASTDLDRFPLFVAAQNGDAAMVRLLVAHGANLNQEDPLHRLPEEMIPEMAEGDPQARAMEALYEHLSGWRVNGQRPAIEPSVVPVRSWASDAQSAHPLATDSEDDAVHVSNLLLSDDAAHGTHVAPAVEVEVDPAPAAARSWASDARSAHPLAMGSEDEEVHASNLLLSDDAAHGTHVAPAVEADPDPAAARSWASDARSAHPLAMGSEDEDVHASNLLLSDDATHVAPAIDEAATLTAEARATPTVRGARATKVPSRFKLGGKLAEAAAALDSLEAVAPATSKPRSTKG